MSIMMFSGALAAAGVALVAMHRARVRADALAVRWRSEVARLRHQNEAYRLRLRFAGLDERLPDIPDGPPNVGSGGNRPLFQILAAVPAARWPAAALDRIDAAMGHPPIAAGKGQRD